MPSASVSSPVTGQHGPAHLPKSTGTGVRSRVQPGLQYSIQLYLPGMYCTGTHPCPLPNL